MMRLGKERDQLNIVFDQVGSPTYAKDLAKTILDIIPVSLENKGTEIYHFSNEGVTSWYDFAKFIMDYSKIDCKLQPILSIDFPLPAPRPSYSVLNKSKIKDKFHIEIPYWTESLKACIDRLK